MPDRRRSPVTAVLALATIAALVACGQPAPPVDPATLEQDFSFRVANPDGLSGAVFAPIYEAFGTFPVMMITSEVAPAQATAIRDAMEGSTLALSGQVEGTLPPIAGVSRINEAFGFLMGGLEFFFVPEGCDVTTENAAEAAFATMIDLIVWDGTTLDANGLPMTEEGSIVLETVAGDVETYYLLAGSKTEWSARSNGPCEVDATTSYELDLDAAVGWQFLRVTFDTTVGAESVAFETVSLEDVAAGGAIGIAEAAPLVLSQQSPRLVPLYR
jgi:hypothetical protein